MERANDVTRSFLDLRLLPALPVAYGNGIEERMGYPDGGGYPDIYSLIVLCLAKLRYIHVSWRYFISYTTYLPGTYIIQQSSLVCEKVER